MSILSAKSLVVKYKFIFYSTPPNATFYVDDVEDPWTYSEKFDFIYARMMTGSIADWPKFFKQSNE